VQEVLTWREIYNLVNTYHFAVQSGIHYFPYRAYHDFFEGISKTGCERYAHKLTHISKSSPPQWFPLVVIPWFHSDQWAKWKEVYNFCPDCREN